MQNDHGPAAPQFASLIQPFATIPRLVRGIGLMFVAAAALWAATPAVPPASAAEGFGETVVESAADQPADGNGEAAAINEQVRPSAIRKRAFWAHRCRGAANGGQRCHIEHAVLDPKHRQIVRFAVADVGGVRRLVVFAPVGLKIPYGVHVRIDKLAPRQLRLETCDRQSCEAELAVDAALSRQLADGARIAVLLQDGRSGRRISVAGSLQGFTVAYRRAFGGSP